MTLYKTNARLRRESNDRVIAARFAELRKQYPAESNSTLIMTIAQSESTPYGSFSGVRNSLIRTKTI